MPDLPNRVAEVPSVAAPTFGSTVARHPMNPAAVAQSPAVMAWLSPTGQMRSLPTNIRDMPSYINTNTLRSGRVQSFADPLPVGGRSYAAGVNVDNYVEERRDRDFKSGSVPSLIHCIGMYKSEYTDRFNEACGQYRNALVGEGLVAKVPAKGQDYRNSTRVGYDSKSFINYTLDGFARGVSHAHADATVPCKQGAAWVGTAPARMYATIAHTQQARAPLEFQKIHPSADGKMKAVMTCTKDGRPTPSEVLDKTLQAARLGEEHGMHWQSMYSTEICKLPRK